MSCHLSSNKYCSICLHKGNALGTENFYEMLIVFCDYQDMELHGMINSMLLASATKVIFLKIGTFSFLLLHSYFLAKYPLEPTWDWYCLRNSLLWNMRHCSLSLIQVFHLSNQHAFFISMMSRHEWDLQLSRRHFQSGFLHNILSIYHSCHRLFLN